MYAINMPDEPRKPSQVLAERRRKESGTAFLIWLSEAEVEGLDAARGSTKRTSWLKERAVDAIRAAARNPQRST